MSDALDLQGQADGETPDERKYSNISYVFCDISHTSWVCLNW